MEVASEVEEFQSIALLDRNGKRGLAGLVACLLSQVNDASEDLAWSKIQFHYVVHNMVCLSEEQYEAYAPMMMMDRKSRDTCDDFTPFLDCLPMNDALMKWSLLKELMYGFITLNRAYDARLRVLFRKTAQVLGIPWTSVMIEEHELGDTIKKLRLRTDTKEPPGEMPKKKVVSRNWQRQAKIGVATAAGATLLAITGGLAAPALGAGIAALGGSTTAFIGASIASTSGITITTAIFGAAGGGLAGYKADRRTLGVRMFQFLPLVEENGTTLCICISGWIQRDSKSWTAPVVENNGLTQEEAAGETKSFTGQRKTKPSVDFTRPWGNVENVLDTFYRIHNPDKVSSIPYILQIYRGKENQLIQDLRKMYHIEDHEPFIPLPLVSQRLTTTIEDEEQDTDESKVENESLSSNVSNEEHQTWLWNTYFPSGDKYCLCWEQHVLENYGKELHNFVSSKVMDFAAQEAIKQTVLAGMYTAVALPTAVLKFANMIDAPWTMAIDRANEAGKLLARALLSREQGRRPVTLIGYSMGARLIFSCLTELGKRSVTDPDALGIIENAVLLGPPISPTKSSWEIARRCVAGRVIHGYSVNDYVLKLMYRYQNMSITNVCGTSPINRDTIEDVDLSSIIGGHLEYRYKIRKV